jgi:hypothetical protein
MPSPGDILYRVKGLTVETVEYIGTTLTVAAYNVRAGTGGPTFAVMTSDCWSTREGAWRAVLDLADAQIRKALEARENAYKLLGLGRRNSFHVGDRFVMLRALPEEWPEWPAGTVLEITQIDPDDVPYMLRPLEPSNDEDFRWATDRLLLARCQPLLDDSVPQGPRERLIELGKEPG